MKCIELVYSIVNTNLQSILQTMFLLGVQGFRLLSHGSPYGVYVTKQILKELNFSNTLFQAFKVRTAPFYSCVVKSCTPRIRF